MAQNPYAELQPTERKSEIIHAAPRGDCAYTTCCWKSPLELPIKDRITMDNTLVTCNKEK